MGTLDLKIMSANYADLLTKLSDTGILLVNIKVEDQITVYITVNKEDYIAVKKIIEKHGGRCEVTKKHGVIWGLKTLINRPILVLSICLLVALVLVLPGRILFVSVDGNTDVPSTQILDIAASAGVGFGAKRAEIRNEKVKNILLEKFPQLQWVGVNTYGCNAVISVQERAGTKLTTQSAANTNIIAAEDGVVTEMIVMKGIPLCVPGQAVKKDQVLISGYADYGLLIKAIGTEGEVLALTNRKMSVITPVAERKREECTEQKTRYSLLVGKKLINLYKDSGISPTNCVRMYMEKKMRLPGGFQLPVGVVVERCFYYDETVVSSAERTDFSWMQDHAEQLLIKNTLGGQILKRQIDFDLQEDVCLMNAEFQCKEIISRIRYEEILQRNE